MSLCTRSVFTMFTKRHYDLYSGPPDSVSNIQGYQLDHCCVFISWDPPYTLPGLTVQYLISVGTEQHELISTNYTYCPLNLTNKEYHFNITTSNRAGNGSSSDVTIDFSLHSGMNSYYYYYYYMLNCINSLYYLSRQSYLFLE